jgi:DNA repair protein RecO (recombination protein O)
LSESVSGIVIHSIPHSDKTFVCRIFLRGHGLRSFLVRRGKSPGSANAHVFQPLNRVDFATAFHEGKSIFSVKDPSLARHWFHISGDPVKASVALFISELLYRTMEDGYVNDALFAYLEQTSELLDSEDTLRNFPVWFVLALSRIYGFDPASDRPEHIFPNHRTRAEQGLTDIVARLVHGTYSEVRTLTASPDVRRRMLSDSVHYLFSHMGQVRELKSLNVLHEVLHG